MPPLYIFGWRCGVGSDDLVLPGVFSAVMELLWLTVVVVAFALSSCWGWKGFHVFFVANIVLGILLLICYVTLTRLSMRGTIMDTTPRRNVPYVLTVCITVFIVRMIFDAYGTYQAFASALHCDQWEITTVKALVLFRWSTTWIMMIVLVIILDVLGYRSSTGKNFTPTSFYAQASESSTGRLWETRCRILCCCSKNIDDTVFINIAHFLTSVFGDIDLVLSDILIGLTMVYDEDKNEMKASTETVSVTSELDRDVPRQPWMTPKTALGYLKYALGCYSWPLYISMHLATGVCRLCPYLKCCSCCLRSNTSSVVVGDNCCQCDTAAMKRIIELPDDDLLYVSFHNKVYEVPFYVALDHKLSSIIIAIRGTLSFVDVLTDLSANSSPIDSPELPPTFLAHKGMVETAKFVKKKLEEEEILLKATASNPNYSIVITGHSLGAGTAAILATLIRSTYPHLRCFCFSPPKVLMSEDFARYTDDFVMSIVIGYDLIARGSYVALNELKERIVDSLISCKKPKYKYILNRCITCVRNKAIDSDITVPNEAEIESSSVNNWKTRRYSVSIPKMYLPGQILHIYFRDADRLSVASNWKSREAFQKLVVNPDMLKDHTPYVLYPTMKAIVAQLD